MQWNSIVYRLALQQPERVVAKARSWLSPDEQARADRFVVEQPRIQFTLCRAALRLLLAERLGCDPREIRFAYSRLGKPFLAGAGETQSIHFNVSHSSDFGVIGISNEPIGVDIERLQPRINAKSLMNQVLSADEQQNWNKLPANLHAQQIIRLWVCKEALLKAMGLGIAECLKQISFELPIDTSDKFRPRRIDPAIQLHLEEAGNCRCNPWLATDYWMANCLSVDANYYCVAAHTNLADAIRLTDYDMSF